MVNFFPLFRIDKISPYRMTSFSLSYRYASSSSIGSINSSGHTRESKMAGITSSSLSCFTRSYIFIFFILFMKRIAASMNEIAAWRYFLKKARKVTRYLASETYSLTSRLSLESACETLEDL